MCVGRRDGLAIKFGPGRRTRAVDNIRCPFPGAEFTLESPGNAAQEAAIEVVVVGDEEGTA